MRQVIRRLSVAAAAGMFVVLIMGATVTNTGSAEGCGRSFPLCHGEVLPVPSLQTLIEYSHRLVTGIEGVLVVALVAGAWTLWRTYVEVRVLGALTLGFLLLQSAMGAWAVLYPQSPEVLALHFGISLLAFASVFLTAVYINQTESVHSARRVLPPLQFRWAVWAVLVYVLLVVYLGAYVRRTNAELACLDWPLCNGSLFPGFDGPVGIMFAHRVAALGSVLALAGLTSWSYGLRGVRPDLYRWSIAALLLVFLQALSGGVVVLSRLHLASTLSHAGIMALLFACLSYLCLAVLPASEQRRESAMALQPSKA